MTPTEARTVTLSDADCDALVGIISDSMDDYDSGMIRSKVIQDRRTAIRHWFAEQVPALEARLRVLQLALDGAVIERERALADIAAVREQVRGMERENERLNALINNPHTNDFLESVRTEAAHQRERWAVDNDGGKQDADWFWLIGYLAGKALHKPEKQLHHIITTAAACLNWHAARTGNDTRMRPGIEPPAIDAARAQRDGGGEG